MNIKLKPKTYGPLVVQSDPDGALFLESEAGQRTQIGLSPAIDALSPSDLILGALTGCIAISLRMAAKAMALEVGAVQVSGKAIKATDLPNRFGRFEVIVRTGFEVPPETAGELLARTKDICTVSNTLGAEIDLTLNP